MRPSQVADAASPADLRYSRAPRATLGSRGRPTSAHQQSTALSANPTIVKLLAVQGLSGRRRQCCNRQRLRHRKFRLPVRLADRSIRFCRRVNDDVPAADAIEQHRLPVESADLDTVSPDERVPIDGNVAPVEADESDWQEQHQVIEDPDRDESR